MAKQHFVMFIGLFIFLFVAINESPLLKEDATLYFIDLGIVAIFFAILLGIMYLASDYS